MNFDDPVYKRMSRCIRHLEKLLEIADKDMNDTLKTRRVDNRKRWEFMALMKEADQ